MSQIENVPRLWLVCGHMHTHTDTLRFTRVRGSIPSHDVTTAMLLAIVPQVSSLANHHCHRQPRLQITHCP